MNASVLGLWNTVPRSHLTTDFGATCRMASRSALR